MRVDADNCQTVDEKLDELAKRLDATGNFFSFEVHPNIVRADKILYTRLRKRQLDLLKSPEYYFENN